MIYGVVYGMLLSFSGLLAGLRPYRHAVYYLALVFLFLFVAYRYEVGCDWRGYLVIFNSSSWLELNEALQRREPFFAATNALLHRWNLPYETINVVAAAFYFFGFHRIARRQPDRLGFLILSFPILIIHIPMSGIRQGMALGLLCLAYNAFADRKPVRYVIWVLLAGGFHTSALVFLALTPFLLVRMSLRNAILCGIPALPMLYLVAAGDDFAMYSERYLSGSHADAYGAPFRTGLLAIVGLIFLFFLKERWRQAFPKDFDLIYIGAFLLVLSFPLALASSVIGDRMGYYFSILQMIILARIPYMIRIPALHLAPYLAVGVLLLAWIQFSNLFRQCYLPYQSLLF